MKSVIFDMDGVIFDSEAVCIRCWQDCKEAFQLIDVEKMFHQCIGTTAQKTKEIMLSFQGEDFPFEAFREAASNRFHEIEEQQGLPVKKGARELLEYLKQHGYRIGLASSTRTETVRRQLSHAGLISYFEVIVGGDMVSRSKPEPDIYLEACRQLGVLPEESYGIEDSFNGIRAVAAAGMIPVMVPDLLVPDAEMKQLARYILPDLLRVRELLCCRENSQLQADISVIELSDCYEKQAFCQEGCTRIDCKDVEETLFFCSDAAAANLRERLQEVPLHALHFLGSGDYHYLSLFFLERIQEPFTLLLLDHHSDCMESAFGGELLTCGCWVLHALRSLPNLKQVIMIGPADEDGSEELLQADPRIVRLTEAQAKAQKEKMKTMLSKYPVYVSFDKDVLGWEEARTDWSQGSAVLQEVFECLDLMRPEAFLGMDVCGEGSKEQSSSPEVIRVNNDTNHKVQEYFIKRIVPASEML